VFLFLIFQNDFATNFALSAVSVALNGVGHGLVGRNHFLAVGTLHVLS